MRKSPERKNSVGAVILAAGKGKRMADHGIPKVMNKLLGQPMISLCLDNLRRAGIARNILIVGHQREQIVAFLGDSVEYVIQEEQLGTGHAVACAREKIKNFDMTLVCYGDKPLFRPETIKKLINLFEEERPTIAIASVIYEDSTGYGRIKRDKDGNILGIVEEKDCNVEEKSIKECNAGLYAFDSRWLSNNINALDTKNAQKEFYLTDLVELAVLDRKKVVALVIDDKTEPEGINTQEQLVKAEAILMGRG